MKKTSVTLIALFSALLAGAQVIPESYLKKIPALPHDSCNITRADIESFRLQVNNISDQLEIDIDKLNDQLEKNMEDNEETAKEAVMNQLSQQYGMSQEDINKIKNGKGLSDAEKQALANKMTMQQANISIDEAQKLSKMSEAGQKAYAEAYAAEAMATAQTNPKQQSTNDNAKNLYQLASSQSTIANKINSINQKINNLYAVIEADPSGQEMIKKIDKWNSEIMSMTGIDYGQGKEMDSLALLVKKEKTEYCNKFTPRYRAALREHLKILKTSLPDYQSLGDITAEITKAQTGITTPPECNTITSLKAIQAYLGKLEDAYEFKLYYPEDEY